jgi:hypothetical protein
VTRLPVISGRELVAALARAGFVVDRYPAGRTLHRRASWPARGLNFAGTAPSAEAVLLSAVRDVRKAASQATLVEIEPDLVGLTDAARLLGVSRQNLHKLRRTHPETFPSPVHEGSTAIWHLEDLLSWLKAYQGYQVPPGLEELAATTKRFNLGRRIRELAPESLDDVRSLIG